MQRLSLIILNICPRNCSVEAPGVPEAVVLDGVQGGVPLGSPGRQCVPTAAQMGLEVKIPLLLSTPS